jgi:antirestriction protein
MRIEIDNKSWYDLSDFDSYEEIEDLGEVTGTSGIPDCIDLERDWDTLQAYLGLSEDDQQIVVAYAEDTDNFDPEEAMEAFVGRYRTPESFCEDICEEIESEALEDLPSYLRNCIDWELVWSSYLRHDYFEQDGYYFRNL